MTAAYCNKACCLGSDRRASTTAAASNTPAATSCSSRRRSAARVPPRSSRTRAATVPTAALAACTGLHCAGGLLLVEASPPAVIAGMGESAVGTCAAIAFACLRQARTGRRAAAGMSVVAGNRRPTGGRTSGAFAAPTWRLVARLRPGRARRRDGDIHPRAAHQQCGHLASETRAPGPLAAGSKAAAGVSRARRAAGGHDCHPLLQHGWQKPQCVQRRQGAFETQGAR